MLGSWNESALKESWLTGAVANAALVRPVSDARVVCVWTEPEVRALRDSLQSVFEQWRNEKGILPDDSNSGLLGNLYEGKSLDECPPYKCAGASVWDYPGLLAKLRAEQYPPLLELEAEADSLCNPPPTLPGHIPRLPDAAVKAATKPGMQRILAALVLSEAAAGNVESATKAHWELSRIRDENQRRADEEIRTTGKVLHRFTMAGIKSHQGYKSRDEFQDKIDCQAIAKTMWEENSSLTIAAIMGAAKIAPYAKKYRGKNTLRIWLSEIDPRPPEKKRGRPKTKN